MKEVQVRSFLKPVNVISLSTNAESQPTNADTSLSNISQLTLPCKRSDGSLFKKSLSSPFLDRSDYSPFKESPQFKRSDSSPQFELSDPLQTEGFDSLPIKSFDSLQITGFIFPQTKISDSSQFERSDSSQFERSDSSEDKKSCYDFFASNCSFCPQMKQESHFNDKLKPIEIFTRRNLQPQIQGKYKNLDDYSEEEICELERLTTKIEVLMTQLDCDYLQVPQCKKGSVLKNHDIPDPKDIYREAINQSFLWDIIKKDEYDRLIGKCD
jgi:hypothetical protein